jgi:hypothetical protein
MKVQDKYFDEIFGFKGLWDAPSKCGLKIIARGGRTYVVVTELYQDNTGTSVTQAGRLLAEQICAAKGLSLPEIVYLECTPDTNSVLSFYDENYFEVKFDAPPQQRYRQLSQDEVKELFS